jgi:alpha-beta hydrolase superfamily lysophospholipase
VRAFLTRIHAEHPQVPVFLWGYSLGALIALEYALRLPETLNGVIVMGAPLEPVGVAKPHLVLLAKALSRIAPGFQVKLGLNVSAVTRDPQVIQAGVSDPLMHPWASVRWGTECLHAVEWVKAHPADLHLPVFFLHGEADPYNQPEGVRAYFEKISYPDKEVKIYPDALHELHNDLGHEQVIADMESWMSRHLARQA